MLSEQLLGKYFIKLMIAKNLLSRFLFKYFWINWTYKLKSSSFQLRVVHFGGMVFRLYINKKKFKKISLEWVISIITSYETHIKFHPIASSEILSTDPLRPVSCPSYSHLQNYNTENISLPTQSTSIVRFNHHHLPVPL